MAEVTGLRMSSEKRITWKCFAFNNKNEELGYINNSLWHQIQIIRMSPGCLQEVVEMFGTKDKEIAVLNFKGDFSDDRIPVWDRNNLEMIGALDYEKVGAHMHWCWYQNQFGLPKAVLLAIREKQKELINLKRKK